MKIFKGSRITEKIQSIQDIITWEEESGFLDFLAAVPAEVKRFDDVFGFGINNSAVHPEDIDGDTEMPCNVGFVYSRNNPLMPELTYCLYSILSDKLLYGYIGLYKEGSIKTLRQLEPVKDFKKGNVIIYDWMRQLVRASCEKITW